MNLNGQGRRRLTRAKEQASNLVGGKGGGGSHQAEVQCLVAHLFHVAERGGNLVVVSVQLPHLVDLVVDYSVFLGKHIVFGSLCVTRNLF